VRAVIKYAAIEKNYGKYPISTMCKFFGVSQSGYYAYLKRTPSHEESKLAGLIRECQKQVHNTYGYRRVRIWLERRGIKANHKAVLRIMQKYGLLAQIRRRRNYRKMSETLYKYPNLLNRDFRSSRPNEKWVTDISYIPTEQGTVYLSVIRDLYDLSIVAHRTGTEQSIHLVLKTLKDAKRKEKIAAELQLHSDQGFQYTSHGYSALTQKYGITPSMSRRANPYDNAMAENFFSILKSECLRRRKPKTIAQAKELIDDYIYFYNNERIQLKTKQTPLEKRRLFK
jgi:putative transposase